MTWAKNIFRPDSIPELYSNVNVLFFEVWIVFVKTIPLRLVSHLEPLNMTILTKDKPFNSVSRS